MRQEEKRYYSSYINGSTARKLNTAVEADEYGYAVPDERIRREERRNGKSNKRQKANNMDLVTFIVMTAAIAITLITCVDYLRIQSQITEMSKNIAGLESEILTIKNENTVIDESIQTSIDYETIFKIATEELDMVYANKNQVVKYTGTKSDYVRQYGDIPKVGR